MDPIRVALFGQGFVRTVILPCLRQVEGIDVAGIASPNQERLRDTATRFAIPCFAPDHRAVLAETKPHLAIIGTPPHRHAAQAIDALGDGCHVLCEKPMALEDRETARMVEAAASRPAQLALIDHELRFHPARLRLRQMIARGELGRIESAEYRLESPGRTDPESPWTWWSDAGLGGGALGAIGSHAVDALRWMLGEVTEAEGRLQTVTSARPDPATGFLRRVTSDDRFDARLRFATGMQARIEVSLVEARRAHWMEVRGTRAWARVTEQGPITTGPTGNASDPAPRTDAEAERRAEHLDGDLPPSDRLGIPDTDWARSLLRMMRRMVAAIREARPLEDAATFVDGHRTQLVLDAIRRSNHSGRWEPSDGGTG